MEMKFKQYIDESRHDAMNKKLMKKYNITKKDISHAQKFLMKKYNVKKQYMEWAFVWEPLEDTVLLSFNIMDPEHQNYKSTMNYQFLPIPEG